MPAIIIPTKGRTLAFCTAELGLVGLTFSGCRRGKRREVQDPHQTGGAVLALVAGDRGYGSGIWHHPPGFLGDLEHIVSYF